MITINRRRLSFVFIPVLIVALLSACSSDESGESEQNPASVVSVASVEQRSISETTNAIGSLEADQVVQIRPEIAGRLEHVGFEEGDTVEEESLLFEIDDESLRARVRARESQLEEARSEFANAERTYNRQQRLYQRELTSGQERDNALESYETARSRVNRLEAELDEARELLEDATIRAPFTGMVGERRIDVGNVVQPEDWLTTLYKLDPMRVRFSVPERYASRLYEGQEIRVTVSAFPDRVFEGEVYYVSPGVREQTRDLQVKARITNSNFKLRPGMFAQVELLLETRTQRPVIPAEALISTREGYVVFRLEDNTVHRQPVKIGLREPGRVEIRDGLAPGETVVRSGHMVLSDGMDVNVVSDGNNSDE